MTRLGWIGTALIAGVMLVGCGGSNKAAATPDDSKNEMKRSADPTSDEAAPDEGTGDSPDSDADKEGENDGANPCGGY